MLIVHLSFAFSSKPMFFTLPMHFLWHEGSGLEKNDCRLASNAVLVVTLIRQD